MRQSTAGDQEVRGSIAVLMALSAVAVLGFAALAIDVGYGLMAKAELQNAADAGSMAGNHELFRIYAALGNADYTKYTLTSTDKTRVITKVNSYTQANEVAGVGISISPADVVFGKWDNADFTPTSTGANAVQVTAHRDSSANGAITTLLAGVLGVHTMAVKADASTTGVSGLKVMPAGKGDIPVGIARFWFTSRDSPCGANAGIRFYPTGDLTGCAGWHVFTESPSSAAKLSSILVGMKNGTFSSPTTVADSTYYNFTGGTVASCYSDMQNLYNAKKDEHGQWLVHIPVYDQDNCANPTSNLKIIGFATARIYKVANKEIWANVECAIVPWGEGGGPYYGTSVGKGAVIE